MKKITILSLKVVCALMMTNSLQAQIGIGTTSPDPSSVLDITSANSGVLIPRVGLVNNTDVATIPAPAISLLVYNNGFAPNGYYYWNGALWVQLAAATPSSDWELTGNTGTSAGTNYLGTTDAVDLRFKTGATDRWNISHANNGQLQSYSLGTSPLPAYSFQSDTNTGIFSPIADNLSITTNGTEKVRVTDTGQVGIGATSPNGSLEITSTNDGLLIPRIALSATNVATVITPTTSELVYNTFTSALGPNQVSPGYYYWDGAAWIKLATGNTNNDWSLIGNTGTTAGTNYLGTTDAVDVRFKTGATDRWNISHANNGQLQSYSLGTAIAPTYSFQTDQNTGVFSSAADVLDITTGGTARFRFPNVNQVHALSLGTAALPFYSFSADSNTGVFSSGADALDFATNGTAKFRIPNADQVHALSLGTAALPFYTFSADSNTGIFSPGADILSATTAGTERLRIEADGDVGIGATPNASAKLEINATNRGLLIPNVALTAKNAAGPITAPATSLLVYNTATAGVSPNNVVPGYYYWNGAAWVGFTGANSNDWSITGNTGTGAANYVGTSDAIDLKISTNGTEKIRVLSNGQVVVNNTAVPIAGDRFSVYNTTTSDFAINGYSTLTGTGVFGQNTGTGSGVFGLNNSSGQAVRGANTGTGIGVLGTTTNAAGTGVYGQANVALGVAVYGTSNGTDGTGVFGNTSNTNGTGMYGQSSGTNGTGVFGFANAAGGDGLYGEATQAARYGVWGVNNNATGYGVYGSSTGTTGYGVHGNATGTSGTGVYGLASQPGRYGVLGSNNNATGIGVFGSSTGSDSTGVIGSSTGTNSDGVFGQATGTTGYGVWGINNNATGNGVVGTSTGNTANGVAGTVTGTSGNGVFGSATGATGYGVYGINNNATGNGVVGSSSGTSGTGIYGTTTGSDGTGVWGNSTGSNADGVYGQASGATGIGVWGVNNNATGTGVYGSSTGTTGTGIWGNATGTSADAVFGSASGAGGFGTFGLNSNAAGTGIVGAGNNVTASYSAGGSGGAFTGSSFGTLSYSTTAASGVGIAAAGNNAAITSFDANGAGGAFTGNQWGTTSIATITGAANDVIDRAVLAGTYISGGSTSDNVYVGARIGGVNYKILGTGGGSVSTTMKTSQGERILFAPEAPENWFFDIGEVELVNGMAAVQLDPTFVETISDSKPFKVFVQGGENTLGSIRITRNQKDKSFIVEDLGGPSNGTVQYNIYAIWKGKENIRFPELKEVNRPKPTAVKSITVDTNSKKRVSKESETKNSDLKQSIDSKTTVLKNNLFPKDKKVQGNKEIEKTNEAQTSKKSNKLNNRTPREISIENDILTEKLK